MVKTNNVLFLGAGASHDANYPLTQNIFDELEKHCKSCCETSIREQWKIFEELRENLSKDMGVLAKSKNPEFILTLPDLLASSAIDHEYNLIEKIDTDMAAKNTPNVQDIQGIHEILDDEKISQSKKMTRIFESILGHYFLMRHCEDRDRELPPYLDNMLRLANCVITTNWDTLVERVLLKEKRWFPSDGYGFHRTLKELDALKPGKKIPCFSSKIKVLKIHGSIGWYERGNTFYLRYSSYLQYLLNNVCDQSAPKIEENEGSIMLYPSYLKQLDNHILLSIWEQARRTLETASSVTIVGYSLPKADVAIRALLLPLRTNKATVEIVSLASKTSEERKRWDDYFKSSKKTPTFTIKTAAERFP